MNSKATAKLGILATAVVLFGAGFGGRGGGGDKNNDGMVDGAEDASVVSCSAPSDEIEQCATTTLAPATAIGPVVEVPDTAAPAPTAAPSTSGGASRTPVSAAPTTAAPATTVPPTTTTTKAPRVTVVLDDADCIAWYIVQPGDTWDTISRKTGYSAEDIAAANSRDSTGAPINGDPIVWRRVCIPEGADPADVESRV